MSKHLTEGRMSKGGQNDPADMGERPPAPQGSGGATIASDDDARLCDIERRRFDAIGAGSDPLPVWEIIMDDVPWLIEKIRELKARRP